MKLFPALSVRGIEGWTKAKLGMSIYTLRTQASDNRTIYVYGLLDEGGIQKLGFVRAAEVPTNLREDYCYAGVLSYIDKNSGKIILGDHLLAPSPGHVAVQTIATEVRRYLNSMRSPGELCLAESYAAEAGIPLKTTDTVLTNGSTNYGCSQFVVTPCTTSTKEKTMNQALTSRLSYAIDMNKKTAATAGFLEAGKIANNKLAAVVAKASPILMRGYIDTTWGKLVLANVAAMAVREFSQSEDVARRAMVAKYPNLERLTDAMVVQAYNEIVGGLQIEGFLDALLGSPEIKAAMDAASLTGA